MNFFFNYYFRCNDNRAIVEYLRSIAKVTRRDIRDNCECLGFHERQHQGPCTKRSGNPRARIHRGAVIAAEGLQQLIIRYYFGRECNYCDESGGRLSPLKRVRPTCLSARSPLALIKKKCQTNERTGASRKMTVDTPLKAPGFFLVKFSVRSFWSTSSTRFSEGPLSGKTPRPRNV